MYAKHSDKIDFFIGKVNDVLASQDIRWIEENDDFVEDEFSHENYVVYTIKKPNAAEIRLVFTNDGVEIGINEFYEMMYFSYEHILDNQRFCDKWFADLFFCAIVIKSCLFGFNFLYVKNSNGNLALIRKFYFGCVAVLLWPLASLHLGC